MIRLACLSGATRILVCVCLSQLPSEERFFFDTLETMRVRRYRPAGAPQQLLFADTEHDTPTEIASVPVTVRFLNEIPFRGYEPHECPACRDGAEVDDIQTADPLLREFTEAEGRRSVHRDWEEVRPLLTARDGDTHISSDRTVGALRFAESLRDASVSTTSRIGLLRQLQEIEVALPNGVRQQATMAENYILLLAAESHWLHRAPLHLSSFRAVTARIASRLASAADSTSRTRADAIRVLRGCSKELFFARLPSLIESCASSDRLLSELLFHVFTFIRRPYHRSEAAFAPVVAALEVVKHSQYAEGVPRLPGTVDYLLHLAKARVERARREHHGVLEAWLELRELLVGPSYGYHNTIYRSILRMESQPRFDRVKQLIASGRSGHSVEMPPDLQTWIRGLARSWSVCCEFLDIQVFPLLERCGGILDTADAERALGGDTCLRLTRMIESKSNVRDSEFSQLVSQLSARPVLALDADRWGRYRREVSWWAERFLTLKNARYVHHPARLISLLERAPIALTEVLQDSFEGHDLRDQLTWAFDGPSPAGSRVLCTNDLLHDIVDEVIVNAVEKHRRPGGVGPVTFKVSAARGGDSNVLVRITNDSSHATRSEGGQGLRLLRKRLEGFAGRLGWSDRGLTPPWTFRVEADFRRVEDGVQ
jgi:hypothetical protein